MFQRSLRVSGRPLATRPGLHIRHPALPDANALGLNAKLPQKMAGRSYVAKRIVL
jgi:hypothetical protein